LPEEVRESIKFVFVDSVDQVIEASLDPAERKSKRKAKAAPKELVETMENA
jgi:hypothetical protein